MQLSDSSAGNPTSIEWDLGNGTITTVKKPQVVYDVTGTYSVKLTITDGTTTDVVTKTITVYAKPSVDFSGLPLNGCPPLNTQFTGNITSGSGSITSSIWDFGDGEIYNGNNPAHIFKTSGSYSITLTVTNSFGCRQTVFKDGYVQTNSSASANFNYTYSNACVLPTKVNFTSAGTTVADATYQWHFGDNNTSTDKNPEHTFMKKGSYVVKLTTTSPNGCVDTSSKIISVGTVNANFEISAFCAGTPATFINNSTPSPVSATWSFGDGTTANTLDAIHNFPAAGSYNVTMNGQFSGCSGSITKTIKVANKALPSFTVTDGNGCSYPRLVTFNNTSTGGVSYKWFFGDGDSSKQINPKHTYNQQGIFSVTLIVYNINGCPDTLVKDKAVQISPPQIKGFANLPANGCTPFIIKPQTNIYSPEPVVFYEWDFGDGQKSNEVFPQHTYTKQGSYQVTLIVRTASGCSDTLSLDQAVSAGSLSKPNFTADTTNTCAQTPIGFTDQSTGKVTSWDWDFGDGENSILQNPTHAYKDTGYFTVSLTISNTGCPAQTVKKNYIHIKPPVAIIQSRYLCNASNEIDFISKSIGAKSWQWDFGDGKTSTNENNTHAYTLPGEYHVTLSVTAKGCTASVIDTVNLFKSGIKFTYASPNEICRKSSVAFDVDVTDSFVQKYTWNFGDSITRNNDDETAKHTYNFSGVFDPFLTLTYINGCKDTIAAPDKVRVFGPYAIIDSISRNACKGAEVNFADKSKTDNTYPITKYVWNFGDGKQQTFTNIPFTHTYDSAGVFPVSLKITDSYGCKDSAFKDSAVIIDKLKADFSVLDTLSCTPSPVTFTNSSYGSAIKFLWSFGNGTNATDSLPKHRYSNEDVFDISLTVTDKNGCSDSLKKTKRVTIKNPVASFSLTDTFAVCPPLLVQPQNNAANYDSLYWDFDDNATSILRNPVHNYTQGGDYNISLVAKGYGNCYDTAYKKLVLLGPSGILSYSPLVNCKPTTVSFTAQTKNTVKYLWDFGNGVVPETTIPSIDYTYQDSGIYFPKLLISDAVGCTVKAINSDSVRVADVRAAFAFSIQQTCDSSLIILSDSSVISFDTAKNYSWNFGDGFISSDVNPKHYYKQPGLYNLNLQVTTNTGCTSSLSLPVQVDINTTPQINITSADAACAKSIINFSVTNSADSVTSWQWDFGDGFTSAIQNTTHAYSAAGTYQVRCIGITASGCLDSTSKTITVSGLPLVNAGNDTAICKGTSLQLNATGALDYIWTNNAGLSCTSCSAPVATPDVTTIYYVKGADALGCSATDSAIIKVKQLFTLNVISPDTLCAGNSVQLVASGAEIYNWQPADGLNSITIATPFASPLTTTTYTVTATDSLNCFTLTQQVLVRVFPKPVFNIIDSIITVNIGSSTNIATTSSPDIIKWQWKPALGLNCITCSQPTAQPQADVTYTATATNAGGCFTQDQIVFKMLCNGASVFTPNTFSPNNDGMNDRFYPRSSADFQIRSLRIFNRWGMPVFEKINPSPDNPADGWDGNYLSKPAQEDVYIFVIEINCANNIYPIKGLITLIR